MSFNYRKLRGKIVEVFETQGNFAVAMELSERTISLKLQGKIYFNQSEILRAASLLGVSENEIPLYFFTEDVQKLEQTTN